MRLGRTGRSRTHACRWPGPAHTAHLLASVLGHIPCASSWSVFGLQGHCEPLGSGPHCWHFWSAQVAASHSGGWRTSFCYPCSWCTWSTCPKPCLSRGFLWLTEYNLISRKRSRHTHPSCIYGLHAHSTWVHLSWTGSPSSSLPCHWPPPGWIGWQWGSQGQCPSSSNAMIIMSNNAGFFEETCISQNLPCLISQPASTWPADSWVPHTWASSNTAPSCNACLSAHDQRSSQQQLLLPQRHLLAHFPCSAYR